MLDLIRSLPPYVLDAAGVAGFGLYVLNYTLVTVQVGRTEKKSYFLVNGLAASLVLLGLVNAFNLASAMIQVFWILMSVLGVVVRLKRDRSGAFSSLRQRGFTPTMTISETDQRTGQPVPERQAVNITAPLSRVA